MTYPFEKLQIGQRGQGLARLVPGLLEVSEEQLGGLVRLAGAEQVGHPLADDAPGIGRRVPAERLGGGGEHLPRLGPLGQAREQVFLQKQVRPGVAPRTARQDELGRLQADDGGFGVEPERAEQRTEHAAADVATQGGHRVGCQPVLLRHGFDPVVPQLRRGLGPQCQHFGRYPVDAVHELEGFPEGPGVQLLQGEERVASRALGGFRHRLFVQRKRGPQAEQRWTPERAD